MQHEDLLALTTNPYFAEAKDFIVEGLSMKLNPYENAIKSELQINSEPRSNFEGDFQHPEAPTAPNQAFVPQNYQKLMNTQNNMFGTQNFGGAQNTLLLNNPMAGLYAQAPTAQQNSRNSASPSQAVKKGNPYLKKTNYDSYYERKLDEERQLSNKLIMKSIGEGIKDKMQGLKTMKGGATNTMFSSMQNPKLSQTQTDLMKSQSDWQNQVMQQ